MVKVSTKRVLFLGGSYNLKYLEVKTTEIGGPKDDIIRMSKPVNFADDFDVEYEIYEIEAINVDDKLFYFYRFKDWNIRDCFHQICYGANDF